MNIIPEELSRLSGMLEPFAEAVLNSAEAERNSYCDDDGCKTCLDVCYALYKDGR